MKSAAKAPRNARIIIEPPRTPRTSRTELNLR
jgi:hypothetical protein